MPAGDANHGLRLAGWLGGYPADVAGQLYGLIKSAMSWLVAGLLLTRVWPACVVRRWAIGVAAGCLLVGWALLPSPGWSDVREVLYALPGLALGMWIGERTWREPEDAVFADNPRGGGDAASSARADAAPPDAAPASASLSAVAARAASVCLLAAGALALFDFPLWRLGIALGLAAYAAVLVLRPAAWLVVVPAALPLFDLAHWSGRFFWDEFDLLMLTTLAVALWQGRLRANVWRVPKLAVLLAAFLLATLASLVLGLFPLQAWDLNAFSAYWSHYNSLRVAKGLLWGLVCFALYRSEADSDTAFLRLALGTALGVLGVSVWALWEHALFAGASTTLDYRVTASFSSMHTGGGHFEAYLVMALPFVWGGFFLSRNGLSRVALAAVFLLGAYALFSTVARGGAIALAVAVAILIGGTWLARGRHGRRRRGVAAPLLLGGVTVAVMIAGVSSEFWKQRIGRTVDDAGIRLHHWSEVLGARDRGLATALFGQGLGTLPASNLASRLPDEAGSYRYNSENGNPHLALNSAGTLYMSQRVPPRPGEMLTLELAARAPGGGAGLEISLCEKNLFNSRRCQWLTFDVKAGTGAWQTFRQTFSSGEVGAGSWPARRPVQLSLYNPAAGTVIEIDAVRLLDGHGANLLENGDFSRGGDFWLFKSGDHLFWHAKNLWVHLLFEQGWIGMGLFSLVMLLALVRLARAVLQGEGGQEATVWLAAFGAWATVGGVDSLVDAPRLAQMVILILCVGAAWGRAYTPGRRRPGRSRHRARVAEQASAQPVV
jgi:hypothetical protein